MSSMPAVGPFGDSIYTEVAPLTYDDINQAWSLLYYVDSIGQMFDEIELLARDTDEVPGWCMLLNPDTTPAKALPWLAQFVGVQLEPTLSEADQRAYIKAAAQWRRGSVQAIIETTQFFLTGSKTVRLDERDSSAYHYTVTIDPDEVTDIDAVTAALTRAKPAGLQFQLLLSTTHTYFYVKTTYATYSAAKAANPTYLDLRGG